MNFINIKGLNHQDLPDAIRVGQVWSITWDGSDEILVVIKKILDQDFLACPVSFHKNYYPAIEIEGLSGYYAWPNIEFRYSYSLLDSYYGNFLESNKFSALATAQDEEKLNLIIKHLNLSASDEEAPDDFLEFILKNFGSLKEEILVYYVMQGTILSDRNLLEEILEINSRDAVLVAEGSKGLSLEQIDKLSENLNINISYLLQSKKNSYEESLSMPWWKDAFRLVMEKLGITESEARGNAVRQLSLPARSEGDLDSKILAYFDEILEV